MTQNKLKFKIFWKLLKSFDCNIIQNSICLIMLNISTKTTLLQYSFIFFWFISTTICQGAFTSSESFFVHPKSFCIYWKACTFVIKLLILWKSFHFHWKPSVLIEKLSIKNCLYKQCLAMAGGQFLAFFLWMQIGHEWFLIQKNYCKSTR